MPDTYEARARVNVDTRTALQPLLQGIAVDRTSSRSSTSCARRCSAAPTWTAWRTQVGLDMRRAVDTAAARRSCSAASSARIEIALEPPAKRDPRMPNTLYRITYSRREPRHGARVVDVLLNSFVEDTMGSERTGTATAQRFLREQIADYGQRLARSRKRTRGIQEKEHRPGAGRAGRLFPAPDHRDAGGRAHRRRN